MTGELPVSPHAVTSPGTAAGQGALAPQGECSSRLAAKQLPVSDGPPACAGLPSPAARPGEQSLTQAWCCENWVPLQPAGCGCKMTCATGTFDSARWVEQELAPWPLLPHRWSKVHMLRQGLAVQRSTDLSSKSVVL